MKSILILTLVLMTFTSNAQTRNLEVEPNHSTIGFRIPIAGYSVVTGKFTDYKIDLEWNDEDFKASQNR